MYYYFSSFAIYALEKKLEIFSFFFIEVIQKFIFTRIRIFKLDSLVRENSHIFKNNLYACFCFIVNKIGPRVFF